MTTDTDSRLARIESDIESLKVGQSDIKATLAQIMTLLVRISTDLGEVRGKAADTPTARDFGRLEGRVDALEGRQPVTLAYQPPRQTGG